MQEASRIKPLEKRFPTLKNIPPSYIMMRYLTCDCDNTYFSEDDLQQHFLESGHNNCNRDISTYQCNICTRVFDTEQEVVKHHLMIHQLNMMDRKRLKASHSAVKASKKNPKPCEICGKVLKTRVSLWVHMRNHSGIKPFKCDYCGKAFHMKPNLQKHIYTHTGERPYACKTCPLKFSTPSNLLRHQQLHAGYKPHVCTLCPYSSLYNSDLKLHFNTKHLKIKNPYKRKPRGTGRPRMTITNYHKFL